MQLLQPRAGHRAGTDAVLLAGLAAISPTDRVVDLGSASGAVGLMLAVRWPRARVTFVEREPDLVALCRRNVALNGLDDRADVVAIDVFAADAAWRDAGLTAGAFDAVLTNPPFFDAQTRPSPEPGRRAARSMAGGDLPGWLAGAGRLLRPRGRLALIHRADRLDGCLAALGRGFGSIELRPIYGRSGDVASRILIGAVKGGRAPLRILEPLHLHEADGAFTPAAARLHRLPDVDWDGTAEVGSN